MERRPTHAHGTRAARIHGIAEEANAPDAASTSTSTLSTTPAGAPIPNELVEQSEQPKIEVVKTDDAIDGHDKSETGEQTTTPAPPATALVADANCKMQQHGQPTSTSTANVDGAAATRPGSQEWLAAKQYAMINDQFGQLSAAQKEIEKLKAELRGRGQQDCAKADAARSLSSASPLLPDPIEERFKTIERSNAAILAENARLSRVDRSVRRGRPREHDA